MKRRVAISLTGKFIQAPTTKVTYNYLAFYLIAGWTQTHHHHHHQHHHRLLLRLKKTRNERDIERHKQQRTFRLDHELPYCLFHKYKNNFI